MEETTHIRINKKTKKLLDKLKRYPRESYEEVILKLLKEDKK